MHFTPILVLVLMGIAYPRWSHKVQSEEAPQHTVPVGFPVSAQAQRARRKVRMTSPSLYKSESVVPGSRRSMKGPQCQENYGHVAHHPGEGQWDSEPQKQNTEERTCQLRMTADLLLRLMTRCLTGDSCTVEHAHVWAFTGQRVKFK
jgi:hypothetical protein